MASSSDRKPAVKRSASPSSAAGPAEKRVKAEAEPPRAIEDVARDVIVGLCFDLLHVDLGYAFLPPEIRDIILGMAQPNAVELVARPGSVFAERYSDPTPLALEAMELLFDLAGAMPTKVLTPESCKALGVASPIGTHGVLDRSGFLQSSFHTPLRDMGEVFEEQSVEQKVLPRHRWKSFQRLATERNDATFWSAEETRMTQFLGKNGVVTMDAFVRMPLELYGWTENLRHACSVYACRM